MEMFFELECPHCGHGLRIPVKYVGKRGQCVKCHGAVDTSVNMQLKGGGTLLHNAIQKGDLDLVEFLLTQGADPNAKDDSGITPLDAANVFHQHTIASLLIEKGASSAPAISTQERTIESETPLLIPETEKTRNLRECPACRQKLSKTASVCPHCGHPLEVGNGAATASLVLGILSFVGFVVFCSIPAIILGHTALSKIRHSPVPMRGRSLAIAGLVLGYLNVLLIVLLIVATIVGYNAINSMDDANVAQAQAQIRNFKTALMAYQLKYNRFPSTSEGLEALVNNDKGIKFLESDTIPKDPWDNPYIYTSENTREYRIISYGADGQQGGSGYDADIDSQ